MLRNNIVDAVVEDTRRDLSLLGQIPATGSPLWFEYAY